MSDLVDLIINGDLPRPKDKPLNKKGRCTHCTKLGLDGAGHMVRNCPQLGRPPVKPRKVRPAVTVAELAILEHAARIADGLIHDTVAIAPLRGQHPAFYRLVRRDLLADAGRGVHADDHMREVDLFSITDAGRAALKART